MSVQSDALFNALAAARQLAESVQTTIKLSPVPPAATLNLKASAVTAATGQLQSLLQALETSATVAAKKEQDRAASELASKMKQLRDAIGQASDRLATLRQQGTI